MSLRNLNVVTKIPNNLRIKLKNKRINYLYKKFEKTFKINQNFIVAVSGGPDSLALSFLTKIYSLKNNLKSRYFIIDHKLRSDSTKEAKSVMKILKKFSISSEILTWRGKKPLKNIQSVARKKRYDLLFGKCKKQRINNLVLGHHIDDLYENFFIRLLRGSGLKGLVSFDTNTKIKEINLIRPLLGFKKDDLIFISKYVFNFFVKDPSNYDTKFKRIEIRNLIKKFEEFGLDKKKFLLTINNLKKSNQSIIFYVDQNLKKNTFFNRKKNQLILKESFFKQSYEVIFRSFSESIKLIGMKYHTPRGKKIDYILQKIRDNSLIKETLGGCVIKRANRTIIITKEE